jgi:hypothetical protein
MEGVVRIPSEFSMIWAVLPSMTATHEFVVPRSIPIILPMIRAFQLVAAGETPRGRSIEQDRFRGSKGAEDGVRAQRNASGKLILGSITMNPPVLRPAGF